MTRIFVSYGWVDKPDAEESVRHLRRVYGHDKVWIDDELSDGTDWWEKTLDLVAACDIFLNLLSNDSVNSLYYQAPIPDTPCNSQLSPPQEAESIDGEVHSHSK